MEPRIQKLAEKFDLVADQTATTEAQPLAQSVTAAITDGATAIHTAAWLTKDNRLVVSASGTQRKLLRRRPIASLLAKDLDSFSCSIEDFLDLTGTETTLYLSIPNDEVFKRLVADARTYAVAERLRFLSADSEQLASWRSATEIRLVNSTRLRNLKQGPERFGADVKAKGIDGVAMYYSDWNGGLVTLFHRFGITSIALGVTQAREMANLVDVGIDAIGTTELARLRETVDLFELGVN